MSQTNQLSVCFQSVTEKKESNVNKTAYFLALKMVREHVDSS